MKKSVSKKTNTATATTQPLIGLYPGTFDPVTLGHTDIIIRASRVVQHLVVGVAANEGKGPLFTIKDRIKMVEDEIKALRLEGHMGAATTEVKPFKNLLVDFAGEVGAGVIIRGLRAVSDFEYEFQMAAMNRKLSRVETMFLMSSDKFQFISSRFVKEIARLGGDVGPFVSERVLTRIRKKMG